MILKTQNNDFFKILLETKGAEEIARRKRFLGL